MIISSALVKALKPRNIKVHQVEFITTSDNILTDKELKDTLGISYSDMDDMIYNVYNK